MINPIIKAGIIGGAGYTGGELLRLLVNHPNVEISFIHSKSNAGNPVTNIHTDLLGDTSLRFTDKISQNINVLFLCAGHGDARKFLNENPIRNAVKIIDLSQDFRLDENSELEIQNTISKAHDLKITSRNFIYGLPELNLNAIKRAQNIANPGCFATCIQLGLLPLATKRLLNNEIHINATTGSTGAGQSLSQTSHFTWRNNNLSVYKAFDHQHLNEINQSLNQLSKLKDPAIINFIPQRGDFTRGILANMYTECDISLEDAYKLYESYYKDYPFTYISKRAIDLKQVVNTNKCFIHLEKHGDKLFIISIIDNLLKGASGQAVQNMNLMFGLDETAGLRLKAVAF